ncbi:tetraacyldisaccharide 4'-kinase [Nitrosomonas aestuarii]|uniref:tetraacyldisaccharide 4'-kinase n=1 Tax=Nitrosomonas aestuarii TaxID=52441 RepID=UPI000D31F60F|nr:tetraacyldisaccharide 4'-kinase [Nitrosomonas aestuarii]PTN12768.1 lipid-A-disaccharide kinase [Nitrosomonas aestuarii]
MKLSELYWHRITPLHILLWPLSLLFGLFMRIRKLCYWLDFFPTVKLPVPVIVVDSITTKDGGKTPLILWLVDMLQTRGLRPGIVTRGNLDNPGNPEAVTKNSDPTTVRGKALLMAQRFENICPVWVGGDPADVAQALLKASPECNVIICTTGLQHPRLERDFEIAVADFSESSFGNGLLLPAGPLRTSIRRLHNVDAVVINGSQKYHYDTREWAPTYFMKLVGETIYNLSKPDIRHPITILKNRKLYAIASYENSQWFFDQLLQTGLQSDLHTVAEDHRFVEQDFYDLHAEAVIMPEEDALQCQAFARDRIWALPVEAWISGELQALVLNQLRTKFADSDVLNELFACSANDSYAIKKKKIYWYATRLSDFSH